MFSCSMCISPLYMSTYNNIALCLLTIVYVQISHLEPCNYKSTYLVPILLNWGHTVFAHLSILFHWVWYVANVRASFLYSHAHFSKIWLQGMMISFLFIIYLADFLLCKGAQYLNLLSNLYVSFHKLYANVHTYQKYITIILILIFASISHSSVVWLLFLFLL